MAGSALIAGNTVVFKPSEETPATGAALAEIMRDAARAAAIVADEVYEQFVDSLAARARGHYVEPTVVADLPHGHELERDELFCHS